MKLAVLILLGLKVQPWVDVSLHTSNLLAAVRSDLRHNLLRLP